MAILEKKFETYIVEYVILLRNFSSVVKILYHAILETLKQDIRTRKLQMFLATGMIRR